MPTYSYACTECDNRFDIVQSFSEDSLTVCPQCTGKLRKLFNSVGIVFKGSGFYRTDSRSGSSTVSESSGESKSDSAPVKTEATASKDSSSSSSAKPSTSTPTPAKAAASS
ncbi:FmdB family transcriptional regulator [Rhodococcus sp. BGS-1C]|jgi:putative FmdB family regulatory protein|uniref:FmdB family zinc ribbon protein n=1 Tax=unclassified Rhodococcus (in: high G+C Gram-positive bacteria) TaxID=192944 RepID=UPI0019D1308F|nr:MULTISPECIES: FmdB family zinc ribbon protein [unclassified Rhodococcus (in: high G+C Gram-positive bacteria)]MCC8930655.1 FmdB family transcriptional regulator [Rhodococcus sp. I2R]